jgi:Tol biopolymer transport system component
MNKFIYNFFITTCILFVISCDDFCVNDDTNDEITTTDSTRFKELKTPIEGKLLFVSGPSHYESDTTFYFKEPWDFYQLRSTTFEKLNDTPWFDSRGQIWNVKWSDNGNYLAFYHDITTERNSDDIATMNMSSMDVTYLTESLGDANTYDEAIYKWTNDESFLYFTALPFGISEQDDNISPDIYRAQPDGSLLEQITDNDYYEAHAVPSSDGTKIFYGIYPYHNTPDSVTGFYIYDLTTNTSNRIVTEEQFETIIGIMQRGFHINTIIAWHPSGDYVVLDPRSRDKLVKIDIQSGTMKIFDFDASFFKEILFIDEYSNIAIGYRGGHKSNIFILDFSNGTFENLTVALTTLDNQKSEIGVPTVSPSGNLIAFTAQLNYDTSEWRHDGSLFQNTINQKTDIYMMDLHTRELTRLTDGVDGWEGHLKWIE